MKYPITIKGIKFPEKFHTKYYGEETGTWVSVRPCNEKYKGETFLGILLGELPIGSIASLNKEDVLEFDVHLNPAIYVPELKEIIFGCGSWWSPLESPEELKKITKKQINNIWYVKALKELVKDKKKKEQLKKEIIGDD